MVGSVRDPRGRLGGGRGQTAAPSGGQLRVVVAVAKGEGLIVWLVFCCLFVYFVLLLLICCH